MCDAWSEVHTETSLEHSQSLLALPLSRNLLRQELFECLGELLLLQRSDLFYGGGRGGEAVDSLELETEACIPSCA